MVSLFLFGLSRLAGLLRKQDSTGLLHKGFTKFFFVNPLCLLPTYGLVEKASLYEVVDLREWQSLCFFCKHFTSHLSKTAVELNSYGVWEN